MRISRAGYERRRREPLLDQASFEAMALYRAEAIAALHADIESHTVAPENMGDALYDLGTKYLSDAILRFSGGNPLQDTEAALLKALNAFDANVQGDVTSMEPLDLSIQTYYVEALWLLSLTKLLGLGDAQIERVANFYAADETNDGADELFETLLAKLGRKSFPAEGLIHEDPYRLLLDCINAEPTERPALMTQFLKRWFKGQKECDWWGSHVPRKGMTVLDTGFFGYWAFEAALVTFLWDIDDTSYRDLPHYPKDLADYARQAMLTDGGAGHSFRAAGGAPCPRSGFWFTPARLDSRQRFEQGQTMPQVGGDYGATIWQWDEQQ